MLSEIKEVMSCETDLNRNGLLDMIPLTFNKNQIISNVYDPSQNDQIIPQKISLELQNSRKLLIVGFDPRYNNKVIEELSKYGKIKKTEYHQKNNYILIKYEKEYEARNALKSYDPFFLDKSNKSKIVKIETYFGKIGNMKLKDREGLIETFNSGNRSTTIKIPRKSYLEKFYEILSFIIW
jgi:hypothetical protein